MSNLFKYEIDMVLEDLFQNDLPPPDIEEGRRIRIIEPPPGCYYDWILDIDGSMFGYNTNFNQKVFLKRYNHASIHKWKDLVRSYREYFLLGLSKSDNLLNNEINKKPEYKLILKPDLIMAKKLYYETMTIPVKLLKIIYVFLRHNVTNIELHDSEGELLTKDPPNFLIRLYDYQAKTLTWMRRIESGEITIKYYKDYYHGIPDPETGESFCYVSSKDVDETAQTLAHYHIFQDPPDLYKEFKINGGLLGDIMGNGKTVTGIAHIYSEHCRLGPRYASLSKGLEEDIYLPSRATLILCPNNIIDQWYDEFLKCLGTIIIDNCRTRGRFVSLTNNTKNYRVLKISTMYHLNNLSHADLINADVVIVTYTMMTNTNHIGKGFTKENGFSEQYAEQRLAKMSIPELYNNPNTWTDHTYSELERILPRKLLYLYKWNRIIHDEFHEIISTKTRTNALLFIIKSLLKGRYYWGFSGSSILENETILMNLPYLLHFEDDWSEILPMTGINKTLFFDKCVIKNTKRILPPLKYVRIAVEPSNEEKILYEAMARYSVIEEQVRFACYHNLNIGMNTATLASTVAQVAQVAQATGAQATAAQATAAQIPKTIPINMRKANSTIINRLLPADEIMVQQHEIRTYRISALETDKIDIETSLDLLLLNLKNLRSLSDWAFTKDWKVIQDLYFLTDSNHKDHNTKVKASLESDPNLRRARDYVREYKKETKEIDKINEELKNLGEANKVYLEFLKNKIMKCTLCDFSSSECNKFMVLECRDYFCIECTELMCNNGQKNCPRCKGPFDTMNLANLGTQEEIKAEVRSNSGLARRLWGSKICKVVDTIQEIVNEDETNKVIVFAQWEDLLEQFEFALAEVEIEAVTVKGATSMRTKAIKTFQERSSCKVILLSSVYGASGINLIEANYVLIVHPFLGEMAEQYEYQAICRAYRTGQTRMVTVMHFIREDTIEKPIYAKKPHLDESGVLEPINSIKTSEPRKLLRPLKVIKPITSINNIKEAISKPAPTLKMIVKPKPLPPGMVRPRLRVPGEPH